MAVFRRFCVGRSFCCLLRRVVVDRGMAKKVSHRAQHLTPQQIYQLVEDMRWCQSSNRFPERQGVVYRRRQDDPYWRETDRIRDALIGEFCRRMGWNLSTKFFSSDQLCQIKLTSWEKREVKNGRERIDWLCASHGYYLAVGKIPAGVICMDYGDQEKWDRKTASWNEWGNPHGVVAFQPNFPSWHAPCFEGKNEGTGLIVVARQNMLPDDYITMGLPTAEEVYSRYYINFYPDHKKSRLQRGLPVVDQIENCENEKARVREQRFRDSAKVIRHRRRAREKDARGSHTASDICNIRQKQKGLCAACDADLKITGEHVDHILALALGGDNNPENLQILCPRCNTSKGAKHWTDWVPPKDLKKFKCV